MIRTLMTLILASSLLTPACQQAPVAQQDPVAQQNTGPIQIEVGANGYSPSEVSAPANKPVRLVFKRTSDEGCGQELVFPSLELKKQLPLNQPVEVDVTMPESGKLSFTCGMDMYQGAVIAQ